MRYDGATALSLDTRGNLHVLLPGSEVVMQKPTVYQVEDGQRRERAGRYVLHGRREVGFAVEGVDRSVALVIDPVLDFGNRLVYRWLRDLPQSGRVKLQLLQQAGWKFVH